MEFYLSIDGEKQGPVSIFKVAEWLRSEKITRETLGWHRDLDGWKPLKDIPALETVLLRQNDEKEEELPPPPELPGTSAPPTPPLPSETNDSPPAAILIREARPFTRFWARMFDYTLVSVIVFLFSDVEFPQPQPGESFADMLARYIEQMQEEDARALARTQFLAMVGWHVLEAFLIHFFRTTPGKALFGIRVSGQDGNPVPALRSLGRSFYTYILGAGFYQVPFILIGMTFSFFRLMATGQCLWDQHLKLRVEGRRLSAGRIILAIAAFFGLLLLQSVKFS